MLDKDNQYVCIYTHACRCYRSVLCGEAKLFNEQPLQGLIFKRTLTLKKDLTSDPEWRLYCWDTLQDAEATLRTPASTEKDTRH